MRVLSLIQQQQQAQKKWYDNIWIIIINNIYLTL